MKNSFNKKLSRIERNMSFKRVESESKYLDIKSMPKFTRLLLWLFSEGVLKPLLFELSKRIVHMYKRNGPLFTVMYLKECHRLTMKMLGGHPETCITFPRVATRRGLPLIVPGPLRLRIEAKEVGAIRLTLSLLTVYRVMDCASTLKLSTITDAFSGSVDRFTDLELIKGLKLLRLKRLYIDPNESMIPSVKAGPNYRIATLGATLDAKAFTEAPQILSALGVVSGVTAPSLFELLKQEIENLGVWESSLSLKVRERFLQSLKLGKLSEKKEAAGKVRVFAITDIWTQSILDPLHCAIFRVLRRIPMDGTFDQLAPVRRLIDKGHKSFYSYDLSAATDRLPVSLQEQILAKLIGPEFAQAWRTLLTSRPWYLKGIPYLYAVGQPMGALSSWGMLALTHHLIVQVAASRVGYKQMFTSYALLGDDITIADEAVARSYLVMMTDLGVEINLSKSLESELGLVEFAKRLILDTSDVSPVPPKLLTLLMSQLRSLPTVLRDLMGRGISIETFVSKESGKLPRPILWEVIGPLGLLPSEGLSPFLGNNSLTESELRLIAKSVSHVVNRQLLSFFYTQQQESQVLMAKIAELVYDYRSDNITHDTPVFHHYMNLFINRTIEGNTAQPEQISFPEEREATFSNVYNYISEAVELLDSLSPVVPDISAKSNRKPPLSSVKMKFYRELNSELLNTGVNFGFLTGFVTTDLKRSKD